MNTNNSEQKIQHLKVPTPDTWVFKNGYAYLFTTICPKDNLDQFNLNMGNPEIFVFFFLKMRAC